MGGGGVEVEITGEMRFFAILTRNVNDKLLKKTIEICYTEFKKFFKAHKVKIHRVL